VPEQLEVLYLRGQQFQHPQSCLPNNQIGIKSAKDYFNVSKGLLTSVGGYIEALPGLSISAGGLATCAETVGVTCATAVPFGLAVAGPGLLNGFNGLSTISVGASQIMSVFPEKQARLRILHSIVLDRR